jgi:FkbM family methyltransferase
VGNTGDFHGYSMLVHGYYDWRNIAIAQAVVPAGGTIVEVGANVGTETACFAAVVGRRGRVVAFEPVEENAGWLDRVAAANPDLAIDVRRAAMSDQPGTATFAAPPRDISGQGHLAGSGDDNPPVPDGWDQVTVTVDSLDDALAGVDRIDLLSMDTEGHEPLVLAGAGTLIATHRPVIIAEATQSILQRAGLGTVVDLRHQFGELGYQCYEVGRFGIEAVGTDPRLHGNWLCLPTERQGWLRPLRRRLRTSFLAPPVGRLSPLAGRWKPVSS